MDVFDRESSNLREQYLDIHGTLRKAKLLRAPPETLFQSPQIREWVNEKTVQLALSLCMPRSDKIYELCDRNTLVFAKVILSIYRRANEVFMFHAEGRIQAE